MSLYHSFCLQLSCSPLFGFFLFGPGFVECYFFGSAISWKPMFSGREPYRKGWEIV